MHRRTALTGLTLGTLWAAVGCDGDPRPLRPPTPSATSEATLAEAGTVIATIPAGRWADAMAFHDGTLWVANFESDTVTRIDTKTRAVTATIDVGRSPFSMAVAAGRLWIANSRGRSVSCVDLANNREIDRLALAADPDSLGVVDDVLWVLGSDKNAYLFSLVNRELVATVSVGVRSGRCLVVDRGLWVADFLGGSQSVVRVDAASRRTTVKVAAGHNPIAVTFGFGSGWVANGIVDSTVTRFAPKTGEIQATLTVPGKDPAGILATQDGVWVACFGNGYVYRVDPSSNRVTAEASIGTAAQDIVLADNLLWITDSGGGQVVVVQPRP
jgi:serine/threonine-protein kinase